MTVKKGTPLSLANRRALQPYWERKKTELGPKASAWKDGKEMPCEQCGKLKYKYPRDIKRVKHIFCSRKCAYAYRDEGMTKLQDKVRDSVTYKEWRTSIFERDSFTCVKCGYRGKGLHADHIEAFSVILRKNGITDVQTALLCAELWDMANGQTLCAKCHWQTPNYGSKAWHSKTYPQGVVVEPVTKRNMNII